MSYMDTPNILARSANGIDYAYRVVGGGERLHGIGVPVFVANGDSDPMIRPRYRTSSRVCFRTPA